MHLQLHNITAVESTGQAKAEAQSRAEASRIEGEAAVDQAKLKAQAMKIEAVRTQTQSCTSTFHEGRCRDVVVVGVCRSLS